jgi:hypothetical protein
MTLSVMLSPLLSQMVFNESMANRFQKGSLGDPIRENTLIGDYNLNKIILKEDVTAFLPSKIIILGDIHGLMWGVRNKSFRIILI